MPTANENLMRADLAIADLNANGGLLMPEQSNAFIDLILDEPTILPQSRVIRMNAPQVKINRMGFGSRILTAAAQSGGAQDSGANTRWVPAAQRAKPITTQIQLTSSEVIAEVRLPYEVLEDNIEGTSIEQHIMRLIAQRAALDLEELFLWGDTSSSDPYLALQDGMLKRATAHVVDNASSGASPDTFVNALLAMPQKYLKYLPQMKGFISVANTIKYRQKVSQRIGGYADSALQGDIPLSAQGLKLEGAPTLAMDNIGASGLVTFPSNLLWGIRRDIHVETDKEIRSREYVIVLTMRVATQIDIPDAVVKLINI